MASDSSVASSQSNGDLHAVLADLQDQKLLVVSSRRKNGLIIYKQHHAEFAGPGAVVGSIFDVDATHLIPVGNWSLDAPKNDKERQTAFLMRRQWIKLFNNTTNNPDPRERVRLILNQFENWFNPDIVTHIPDDAIARLVGVLKETVTDFRQGDEW